MTDFVINAKKEMAKQPDESFDVTLTRRGKLIESIFNYANFLKQKPELWQFVPCDDNNVPLVEPKDYADILEKGGSVYSWDDDKSEYEAAKSRVLFTDFEYKEMPGCHYAINGNFALILDKFRPHVTTNKNMSMLIETLEDIAPYNLTLSETALKLINGK